MRDEDIEDYLQSGYPFFAKTSIGEFWIRYVPLGPVFKWKENHIIPLPLQGNDIYWWLRASGEGDLHG